MSQAAGSLTCEPAGQRGISGSGAASTTGLVKKEPALHVSWSAASSTMPLPRRSSSTASRATPAGTVLPGSTPSVRASSAYAMGIEAPPPGSAIRTRSTTAASVPLSTLVRYPSPRSTAGTVLTRPDVRS